MLVFVSSTGGEIALVEEYTPNLTCVCIYIGYSSDINSG